MSKLSVVIPAYNESSSIGQVIRRLAAVRGDLQRKAGIAELEVIVVDDGSIDGTGSAVLRAASGIAYSRVAIRLIPHGSNRGYGAALQTGFAAAQGTWLAFLDADSTYPPEELPELCRRLHKSGAALVLGDRMRSGASQMPAVRWVGNAFLALLASALAGVRIHDCCSGMRVFSAATWHQIRPLPNGLDFTPAMTVRLLQRRMPLEEVVISYHERIGRSKLKIVRDGVRFLGTILREARKGEPVRACAFTAAALASLAVPITAATMAATNRLSWARLAPLLPIVAVSLVVGAFLAGLALWRPLRPNPVHRLAQRVMVPNGGNMAPGREEQRGV